MSNSLSNNEEIYEQLEIVNNKMKQEQNEQKSILKKSGKITIIIVIILVIVLGISFFLINKRNQENKNQDLTNQNQNLTNQNQNLTNQNQNLTKQNQDYKNLTNSTPMGKLLNKTKKFKNDKTKRYIFIQGEDIKLEEKKSSNIFIVKGLAGNNTISFLCENGDYFRLIKDDYVKCKPKDKNYYEESSFVPDDYSSKSNLMIFRSYKKQNHFLSYTNDNELRMYECQRNKNYIRWELINP